MDIQEIVTGLKKIEHGFRHIMSAGDQIYAMAGLDHFAVATALLDDDSYQARMLATYMLGLLAHKDDNALRLLRTTVVSDQNWRVQEMLAKAFDYYCATIGYAHALDEIESWLSDPDPKLNRAVIEGLRIWTGRPFFKTHPEIAISMISRHRANESEYLRKSVGNALRDIAKKHHDLVIKEVQDWDLSDPVVTFTYTLLRI